MVTDAGMNAGTRSAVTKQLQAGHLIDGTDALPFRASEADKLAAIVSRPAGARATSSPQWRYATPQC
jgi:hypothetical protein